MIVKEVGERIDINTPFEVRDVDTDEVLFQSWEDDFDDLPDFEILDDGGITYDKKNKVLVLWVDRENYIY